MRVELTEDFWNLLNPEGQEDGTAWMFTDDHFFIIGYSLDKKVFYYHNPLITDMMLPIDPWFKTAGVIEVTDEHIIWEGYEGKMVLYEAPKKSNIIPFRRK